MKRIATTPSLWISICFIMLFSCCAVAQDQWIIGVWEPVGQGKKIEFFSDKTVIDTDILRGQWVVLEDGRVKITANIGVFLGTRKGDLLIIHAEGKEFAYKKVQINASKKQQPEEAQYETDIIGTWRTNINNRILTETFNKDKSYILKIEIIEPGKSPKTDTVKVPYKFIDSQTIEIGSGSINVIKKLTIDELIMYNEQRGTDIIYKRISP